MSKIAHNLMGFFFFFFKNGAQYFQSCPLVFLALNAMFFSQAQALMKRQHCLEQAGSLL